eukprot:scaffold265113_cov32-Tisochrysis_lutea.AAC.1
MFQRPSLAQLAACRVCASFEVPLDASSCCNDLATHRKRANAANALVLSLRECWCWPPATYYLGIYSFFQAFVPLGPRLLCVVGGFGDRGTAWCHSWRGATVSRAWQVIEGTNSTGVAPADPVEESWCPRPLNHSWMHPPLLTVNAARTTWGTTWSSNRTGRSLTVMVERMVPPIRAKPACGTTV